jgi:hypothetical protein
MRWLWTTMLLISASLVVRIAGISCKCLVLKCLECSQARASFKFWGVLGFGESVWLYSPSWHWTHDSLLFLSLHGWDYSPAPPCLAFVCNFSNKKDLFCFLKQHHQFGLLLLNNLNITL